MECCAGMVLQSHMRIVCRKCYVLPQIDPPSCVVTRTSISRRCMMAFWLLLSLGVQISPFPTTAELITPPLHSQNAFDGDKMFLCFLVREFSMHAGPLFQPFGLLSSTSKLVTRSNTVLLSAGSPAARSNREI